MAVSPREGTGPSPAAGAVGAAHGSNHRVGSQGCLQGLRLKPVIQDLAQETRREPGSGLGCSRDLVGTQGGGVGTRRVALCHCSRHAPWRWGLSAPRNSGAAAVPAPALRGEAALGSARLHQDTATGTWWCWGQAGTRDQAHSHCQGDPKRTCPQQGLQGSQGSEPLEQGALPQGSCIHRGGIQQRVNGRH